MSVELDFTGFEELEKAFKRASKKYESDADALLEAQARVIMSRVKSATPRQSGMLRKSWRVKRVKEYQGGKVHVVRIQSGAPHAHLIEQGHKLVQARSRARSGGRYASTGKKLGKISKYNALGRAVLFRSNGEVPGVYMLQKSMEEARSGFLKDVEKLVDQVCKEAGEL